MTMTMTAGDSIWVRWIIRRDAERVLEIERGSFEYPWDERELIAYLQNRTRLGMVAEDSGGVVGFMLYDLQSGYIKLDSLAVDSSCRRSGVGTILLAKIKSRLKSQNRSRVETLVRESNLSALLFLRSNGFAAVELVRKPYPRDDNEDAYRLEYCVSQSKPLLRNRITA